jgi:hypothetical protein
MADPTAASSAAAWQTGTAVVQAVCSIILLGWYVLAAHLERRRIRREKADDFDALVRLCRDLGLEAKVKTEAHLRAIAGAPLACGDLCHRLTAWRADMTIIYVCLNEVPHYEVRNPAFSTALTRLWLEVDCRGLVVEPDVKARDVAGLLQQKLDRICREVDAMAALLVRSPTAYDRERRLTSGAKRRGYTYEPQGFVRGQTSPFEHAVLEHG